MSNDPFLHELYDEIHATPTQKRLRNLAPIPVGAVFLPWEGMKEEEMREHFRLMKSLGYTCLKQTMPSPEFSEERILLTALEEGICPFWFDRGGWDDITPEFLESLGLSPEMDVDEALENEKVIAHNHEKMKERVIRFCKMKQERRKARKIQAGDKHRVPGVVGSESGHELHDDAVPAFVKWLKKEYGTPQDVARAWNAYEVGISDRMAEWSTWEELEAEVQVVVTDREYRHLRDIMRFRADTFIQQYIEEPAKAQHEIDPSMPSRSGGEMGLFLSFASRGTDMEGMAKVMAEYGSFYPSIHLAWHFEEVEFEVARPMYMQSRITTDWAKGIWTATWESTGGPQFFSGGKSPFVEETRNRVAGYTVDEHSQTQLMLSWLAGGFKGFGLWCWNVRRAGWEAGEFSLLDKNDEVTERAIVAGRIGQAAVKHRRELWSAKNEPTLGILVDWENEAMCAAQGVTGRDRFKGEPVRARIGASRALINANVPWEYVTPSNLFDGLGPRYQVIYAPYALSIRSELFEALESYVKQGGRLVLDMPTSYLDGHGKMINTGSGSPFAELFGTRLREFHYSNPKHTPLSIEGVPFEGFAADLDPIDAVVTGRYQNGKAAITENPHGAGSAVLLGAPAGLFCHRPGHDEMEALLRRVLLQDREPSFTVEGALAYRLASGKADHYFLINDDPAKSVSLQTPAYDYASFEDAIDGEKVNPKVIELPPHSGRWIRALKS